jgi:hypothetical protein
MKSREQLQFPSKVVGGLPVSLPLWKPWGAGRMIGPIARGGPPGGPPAGGPPGGPAGGPPPPAFPSTKGHPLGGFLPGGPPPLFCNGPVIGPARHMAVLAAAGMVWVIVALAWIGGVLCSILIVSI